jgi:UDPglucose 6-dehydrogenase
VTEWTEFKDLDYAKIFHQMQKPAFVFDGRNLLDYAQLREIGFQTYAIGKPLTCWV